MIKNYFKTAFRSLRRNKSYSVINVLGLTVGIAACLLLFLVVRFETSFDKFHPQASHIYRITSVQSTADGKDYSAGVAFPVAPTLKLEFPQLKQVASILRMNDDQLTVLNNGKGEDAKFISSFYYAGPEFFSLFHFPMLQGDVNSLDDPSHALLTKEAAEKYFGDWRKAIGRTIMRNNNKEEVYTITGVLENPPANTDFPLGVVASYASLKADHIVFNMEDWVTTYGSAYTFVEVPEHFSIDQFNADLKKLVTKHKPAEYAGDTYFAQPLSDIHYNKDFGNYGDHVFSHSLVTALSLIGVFLILIACVNFINLATAQAVNRSREVGVRKVMGSNRRQLAVQFLSETALIVLLAIFAAVAIAIALLPFVNTLLGIRLTTSFFYRPDVLLFLLAVTVAVTFLSGFYPAIILSGFNPITALKSRITSKMVGGISLKRGLVVLQFAIAQVLIIGTIIVVNQMRFFRTAALGFDKSEIVTVPVPNDSVSLASLDYLKAEILKSPDVRSVSYSFESPAANGNWNSDFRYDHAQKNTDFNANLKWADTAYFRTYGLEFVAGRSYYACDTTNGWVVNETLLKKLGVRDPQTAIGKTLDLWDGKRVAPIVGVVKDFNVYSLREPMAAVILGNWKEVYHTLNIKMMPGRTTPALARVEKLWKAAFPNAVYDYNFLDKTIRNFYRQEERLSILYKIFAGIAIFISCLGLYGLVSFMAVQRTKEVGIRKVLGASAGNIVFLLSREFTILIIVAFAISAPVAWYLMHQWLLNYTYRVPIGISIFLLAIAGSIAIAWLTVGHRAVKAALANPVKSLRTE